MQETQRKRAIDERVFAAVFLCSAAVGMLLGSLAPQVVGPEHRELLNPTWSNETTMIVVPIASDTDRPAAALYRDGQQTLVREVALYESATP